MRFIEKHQLHLEPKNVPEPFRHLIPLAEKWGIHYVEELDDFEIRNKLFAEATPAEVDELLTLLNPYMNVSNEPNLYQWLAGTEAQAKTMSKEYLAFTFMSMAYDRAVLTLKDKQRNS